MAQTNQQQTSKPQQEATLTVTPPDTKAREQKILFFIFTHFMVEDKGQLLDSIEGDIFQTAEGAYIYKAMCENRGNLNGLFASLNKYVTEGDTERGTFYNWISEAETYESDNLERAKWDNDVLILTRQVREYQMQLQTAELYYLAKNGNITVEAIAQAKEALNKLEGSNADKYAELLQDPTEEDFFKQMSEAPQGVSVNFEFGNDEGDRKRLIIPSGAITLICAPTSHGKSTMLRNLALSMARDQNTKGRVLYFTFEESEQDLYAQLLNSYCGIDLHRPSRTHNNLKTIKEYFVRRAKGEGEQVLGFMGENRNKFLSALSSFQRDYISNGRLKVINKNYDITQLVGAIKYYCNAVEKSGDTVKAIFVDYIQLLSLNDRKKLSRAEELKEVCIELKNFSVESGKPLILASQLNRETKSPLMLFNQNISEASDIEKVANLIICVWNSRFEAQDASYYGSMEKGSRKPNKDAQRLESMGFFAGGAKKYSTHEEWGARFNSLPEKERNTLYCKITKYRGDVVGLDAVLKWNPNTGKVEENYTTEAQTTLNLNENTNGNYDGF